MDASTNELRGMNDVEPGPILNTPYFGIRLLVQPVDLYGGSQRLPALVCSRRFRCRCTGGKPADSSFFWAWLVPWTCSLLWFTRGLVLPRCYDFR